MRIVYDETWREPKPRRWFKIHCFDCKRDLPSKASAEKHKGHQVSYLDEKGEVMD